MDHVGLFSGAGKLIKPIVLPAQTMDAYHRAFVKAIESTCRHHRTDSDAMPGQLVAHFSSPEKATLFTAQVVRSADHATWRRALEHALREHSVIDSSDIDIPAFCSTALDKYRSELKNEASKAGSPLANAYNISHLSALVSEGTAEPQPPTGPISNVWNIPAPRDLLERPEIAEIEGLLAEQPVVAVIGGPGAGKSAAAHMIVDRAVEADPALSVWWMNATSREALEASCAEFCEEFSSTPVDDVLKQAKKLLAVDQRRWLMVLDDLSNGSLIDEVIPSGRRSTQVLVTSRSDVSVPHDGLIALSWDQDQLITEILVEGIPSSRHSAEISELIRKCGGNPLVAATLCRFTKATGASIPDVLALIEAHPDRILDENLGPQYSATFTTIVTSAWARLAGTPAIDILALLALCGGRLSRHLLDSALPSVDQLGRLDGQRALMEIGLIDSGRDQVSCHALVASVAMATAEKTHLRTLVEQVFSAIHEHATESDHAGLLESVRITDLLLRANTNHDLAAEFHTRLLLATALASYGLARTAVLQLDRARDLTRSVSVAHGEQRLCAAESVVLLHRGHFLDAERVARTAVDAIENLDLRTISAEQRWALVQSALSVATCRTYDDDWGEATRYVNLADRASDESMKDGIRTFRRGLLAGSGDPRTRLKAALDIARDATSAPRSRANAFTLASRTALALEMSNDAVSYASEACRIDRQVLGEHTQQYAADLNDLGMALLAVGKLEDAERCLRDAIDIYEGELTDNGNSAITRTHVARVLTTRAIGRPEATANALLHEARNVLKPAERVLRVQAPKSGDLASLLVAKADATPDIARSVAITREALTIDSELFGAAHPEVAIDAKLIADRLLMLDDAGGALDALKTIRPHIPKWESERPTLAVAIQSSLLAILMKRGVSTFGNAEMSTTAHHIKRLLPTVSKGSMEHRHATYVLAQWAQFRDRSSWGN